MAGSPSVVPPYAKLKILNGGNNGLRLIFNFEHEIKMHEELLITISQEEALVLFEWLSREDKAEGLTFTCSAEQKAVWRLEAKLEKLVPVFSAAYMQELTKAREFVDRTY